MIAPGMRRALGSSALVCCFLLAVEARGEPIAGPWPQSTAGTAFTVGAGALEAGLFQPLRYGLTDTLEISTYPLWNLLMPNGALKKTWTSLGPGVLASRHVLRFPTGLIMAFSRAGTGGIWPHETRVPHIIDVENEVLYSVPVGAAHLVTLKAGFQWAGKVGRSTLDAIDLPLLFARTAAYDAGWSAHVGLDFDGVLWNRLSYLLDVDVFILPYSNARYALEQSTLLGYAFTPGFMAQLGYKMTFGPYRFGASAWHIFPLFDLLWRFG